ncbi:MAG: DciA family protein [Gammaproteobacteria bacterium]|jgi:hypothetical protein
MPLKSVSRILAAKNDKLQSLLDRAATLDGINQRLLRFLPSPLNQHVCLANLREDTAVFMADSSAWLTRARYQGPEILKLLRQEPGLERINKLHFKIQPLTEHAERPTSRPQLSENTAELLISTAKIIDDPELKAALHKLSRRHKE